MPAREAVKIVADALKANLQAKLDAMPIESGEAVPVIASFRDVFSDDAPEGMDWPMVATTIPPGETPEGEFETVGKADVRVPIEVQYLTRDADTAQARATAAYAIRGILQVLNDIPGQTRNAVQIVMLTDLVFDFARFEGGETGAVVRFNAWMRDLMP